MGCSCSKKLSIAQPCEQTDCKNTDEFHRPKAEERSQTAKWYLLNNSTYEQFKHKQSEAVAPEMGCCSQLAYGSRRRAASDGERTRGSIFG